MRGVKSTLFVHVHVLERLMGPGHVGPVRRTKAKIRHPEPLYPVGVCLCLVVDGIDVVTMGMVSFVVVVRGSGSGRGGLTRNWRTSQEGSTG